RLKGRRRGLRPAVAGHAGGLGSSEPSQGTGPSVIVLPTRGWPMRVFPTVVLCLAVWTRHASGQSPLAVTPGQGLCRTVKNSGDCARTIDARQIPLSHGRVRRSGAALRLRLTSGRVLSVVDDTVDTAAASPTWFSYLGMCSGIPYYVLWAQHVEGSAIRLVNIRTGWGVTIRDLPIVSPDRRHFVTATQTQVMYHPERLAVWRVEADTLVHEWGLETMDWIPVQVRWVSSRGFQFDRQRAGLHISAREAIDTAEVDSVGRWSTRIQQ